MITTDAHSAALDWTRRALGCVQRRLACSVGDRPIGVRVRNPVAWIAERKKTEFLKPIDKTIVRMASKSSGRNASEPIGGLEIVNSEGRALLSGAKTARIVATD